MNVKKDIVKPVLITFAALIFLFGIVSLIMHLCFPFTMGKMFYKLGADDTALTYFEKDYKKSKNYDELYTILNLSIKLNKNEKVVSYFEKFVSDENYSEYVTNIDNQNLNLSETDFVKSKLYSEDNYLKNRYVLALSKLGEYKKAFEYAKEHTSFLLSTENVSPYLFTFISTVECFNSTEQSSETIDDMYNYFNNVFEAFKSNYTSANKIHTFVLGNRLNEVGNNLKALSSSFDVGISTEQINSILVEVNQKMALLY